MESFTNGGIILNSEYIFLGQDKPIGEIPFTINENGLIMITVQINDQTISNFVLDTEASVTVVDENVVTRLNLPLREEVYQSTAANGVVEKGGKIKEQRISLTEKWC